MSLWLRMDHVPSRRHTLLSLHLLSPSMSWSQSLNVRVTPSQSLIVAQDYANTASGRHAMYLLDADPVEELFCVKVCPEFLLTTQHPKGVGGVPPGPPPLKRLDLIFALAPLAQLIHAVACFALCTAFLVLPLLPPFACCIVCPYTTAMASMSMKWRA